MNGVVRDRGSTTLEVVVIGPALLALLALVIAAGRVALAGQSVPTAAAEAARDTRHATRDTSLQRAPGAGAANGQDTARRVLDGQGLHCMSTEIVVDATDLALPVGRPGAVTVEVACRVQLSDVGLPRMPGTKTLRASSSMPIDPWTARP